MLLLPAQGAAGRLPCQQRVAALCSRNMHYEPGHYVPSRQPSAEEQECHTPPQPLQGPSQPGQQLFPSSRAMSMALGPFAAAQQGAPELPLSWQDPDACSAAWPVREPAEALAPQQSRNSDILDAWAMPAVTAAGKGDEAPSRRVKLARLSIAQRSDSAMLGEQPSQRQLPSRALFCPDPPVAVRAQEQEKSQRADCSAAAREAIAEPSSKPAEYVTAVAGQDTQPPAQEPGTPQIQAMPLPQMPEPPVSGTPRYLLCPAVACCSMSAPADESDSAAAPDCDHVGSRPATFVCLARSALTLPLPNITHPSTCSPTHAFRSFHVPHILT